MTASASYKRPFAELKGCIGERQQPANSGRTVYVEVCNLKARFPDVSVIPERYTGYRFRYRF
jgi:hypothetical protein